MSYELGFAVFYVFIYLSIIIVTVFNYVCVSAFEQGHLDPWRSKSALIIIIIITHDRWSPQHLYTRNGIVALQSVISY